MFTDKKQNLGKGEKHTSGTIAFIPVATLFDYKYIIRKTEKFISSSLKWHSHKAAILEIRQQFSNGGRG